MYLLYPDEELSETLLPVSRPSTPAQRGMEDRLRGCHYLFLALGLMPLHPFILRTEDMTVITVLNGWDYLLCPGVLGYKLHRQRTWLS